MHFIPSWPRGKVSSQEAVRARPPRQAAEGGYVLMAGEKDRDFASGIEACALAKVRVRLVSDSEGLKNLCTREKLCTLTPFLSHGDFMDVLEKSWAVVVPLHPQRHLSAGATLVGEALASGVPVVVSGGLGGDEPWKGVVGHEETGLIVPPGDVGALSSAVSRLMEDGELYGRISANARALAESAYSVEAVGKSMQEAVCGAIAYRNSHRTTRSQEEQEQGRAAFNSFIEDGELDED
uniref:Glycosyl transferase family 1 domain-containing protein n=1 Tax=Tetraselmis sp. GSL018 TaxID=582737 RepID=A0A061S621_9CHLO